MPTATDPKLFGVITSTRNGYDCDLCGMSLPTPPNAQSGCHTPVYVITRRRGGMVELCEECLDHALAPGVVLDPFSLRGTI